jgi:uncharacterized membrane protein
MSSIHPVFVHFPVALLSISLLFELASLLRPSAEFTRAGWWLQLAGTAGILLSVATGLSARSGLNLSPEAVGYVENHEQIALIVAVVFSSLLFWRIANKAVLPKRGKALFLGLFGAGVALMWLGAWYGGELVYRFGAGVGPS